MAQRDEKGRFVRTKPDYKAMYESVEQECKKLRSDELTWRQILKKTSEAHEFLLKHAGPILRWMYKRKFKKDA